MSRLLARLSTLLFGLFVLGGLAFSASTVIGSTSIQACDDPSQIGSCPPYDDELCAIGCQGEFGTTGSCVHGCCTCVV